MSLIKLQGVVIKTINLGENDKIITLITDKMGKIDVVVHGAKKAKSSFLASSQLFCYGEYVVYRGKELYTLSESTIIESFQKLLLDFDKLTYGSYFLELTETLSEKDVRNVTLLALLLKTLYILIHSDVDLKLLKLVFNYKAISISGYMPNIDTCTICRKSITKGYFNIENGGIVCPECGNIVRSQYKVNADLIMFLKAIKKIRLEELINMKYDNEIYLYTNNIIDNYIKYYLGKDFKTLNFINQINI